MGAYEVMSIEVPRSYVKRQLDTPGHGGWTTGHVMGRIVVQLAWTGLSSGNEKGRVAVTQQRPDLTLGAPSAQTLKDEPQPHEPVTFGLPNLKPAPCAPST